ncbi:phage integrase N-terminal SAM-like domain-containing protein [Sorangium sp. So ce302]|uniref:phage integrase N-terminal SAM-like domain-containing protein n=1 Tax=Sorangium sp. So ce302 TaxID=3133297 RepID=UPI003F641B9B
MTLIEAVRTTIRRLHDSRRTEAAYVHWLRQFLRFHSGKPPRQMGAEEVTAFLDELAVARRTAASTQNQALCALLFLYKRVLDLQISRLEALERARRPEHLPSVLSRQETLTLLEHFVPPFRLIGELLYGNGLRLLETLSIRVNDVDLDRRQTSAVQRAVHDAGRAAELAKRATCRPFRQSFAPHLLEAGIDIRTIQTLLGHKDGRTTMIDIHIVDRGPLGVISPLDR